MTPTTFVLLSGTLTFGVPLAAAVWELLTIPPSRPGGGDEPPPEPRFRDPPRPLPDCLLPPPRPAPIIAPRRVRELEDA